MYDTPDGGMVNKKNPMITFVIYGPIEEPVAGAFQGSIESYIHSISSELEQFPSFVRINRQTPKITTSRDQHTTLFKDMNDIEGNLKIGLTDVILYSPKDRKNMFGYGNPGGMAIFSLIRFRNECSNKRAFFDLIQKESIKILSMALDMPPCTKNSCVITYHRNVTDLDLNDSVCPDCRNTIIAEMNNVFHVVNTPDGACAR